MVVYGERSLDIHLSPTGFAPIGLEPMGFSLALTSDIHVAERHKSQVTSTRVTEKAGLWSL